MDRPPLLWPVLLTVVAVLTAVGYLLGFRFGFGVAVVWPTMAVIDAWAWWQSGVRLHDQQANFERIHGFHRRLGDLREGRDG